MNSLLILAIIAVLILVGCYGGTSKDSAFNGPRDVVYYGYYGDLALQFEETKDHVNTVWIASWDRHPLSWADSVFQRTAQASVAGKKIVIMMTNNTYIKGKFNHMVLLELEDLLTKLSGTDYAESVVALYPQDEPDYAGISAEEVVKGNAAIRDTLSKFSKFKNLPLAVFYTGQETYPGIESYDWVGFDEYDAGARALGAKYNRMVERLRSDQRTMIIPGGCDKWRQDPRPFVDFALNNPRVVAVVPFIWIDNADPSNPDVGLGIRSNGLKELYREAGLTLQQPR